MTNDLNSSPDGQQCCRRSSFLLALLTVVVLLLSRVAIVNLGPIGRHATTPEWSLEARTTASEAAPYDKAYMIISKPQNALTVSVIQQLQPAARIYMAYPPLEKDRIPIIQEQLDRIHPSLNATVRWCEFNPFGAKEVVLQSTALCLQVMEEDGIYQSGTNELNIKTCAAASQDECTSTRRAIDTSTAKSNLDGILLNPYGSVGGEIPNPDTGLLPLVEYKLMGSLVMLHNLMRKDLLGENARIIFVGSESARGLPKMGFPVPNLGSTKDSIRSFLTGSTYVLEPKSGDESGGVSSSSSSYRWEQAYGNLCAIAVLYMRHLAALYPQFYFGAISPGMTEESLNPENGPNPTWIWRVQLWCYRTLLFGLLQRCEIAKTVDEGARLLVQALMGSYNDDGGGWGYPSGTFVGARGGTGGPICDQTELEGGKQFLDTDLQQLAYETVQEYLHISHG